MRWSATAMAALWLAALLGAGFVARRLIRRAARRAGRRTLLRVRARVDRFKFLRRTHVRAELLADPALADAVRAHVASTGATEAATWERVDRYIQEIVPFFNVLAYYRIGYPIARPLLELFYSPTVDYENATANARLPRDAIAVYLMNHRSNADYVLVAYALAGRVAVSYAVGEWARVFPLDRIFKAFGSYFVRRRFREPLYHAVLERYVQLITRNGVTQGIFPEGGLSRDGRMRPPKIGLLDYVLGVGRERALRGRMYIVPVAINYDRVLEDRSLLTELRVQDGGRAPSRAMQLREVGHYVAWNVGRLLTRRWRRYGRAAVMIGAPMPLAPWFAEVEAGGADLFALARPERLARVQALCDEVMSQIGALIPVTPVTLACAAIQSLDADFILRSRLLERMMEMRDVLVELNARDVRADGDMLATLELALSMLLLRRVVAPEGDGFAVLPRGRSLVSYYANSIAHLLGPFEAGVRERDQLPVMAATGEHQA